MFIIADKYLMAPLKSVAIEKFTKHSRAQWDKPTFAQAIAEVYRSPVGDESLKHIAVSVTKEHAEELVDDAERYGHFHKMLREFADFGADTSIALAAGNGRGLEAHVRTKTCSMAYICFWCFDCFTVTFTAPGSPASFTCPRQCVSRTVSEWESFRAR